jgi:hypothetical protein
MNLEEYNQIQERLKKGEALIMEMGGFMNAPRIWVKGYNFLANKALMYEIDNDLIPDLEQKLGRS